MTAPVKLIIFDCDGVIADSERLAADLLVEDLSALGMQITFDDVQRDFLGQSYLSMASKLEARFGRGLPEGFQQDYGAQLARRFEKDLRTTPGFTVMLDRLSIPSCVATSSAPERVARTLSPLQLADVFGPNVFTASQVDRGKPAPDLFLFAAQQMQTDPADCLVIEDSAAGVTAARAAGMRVLHYRGGAHQPRPIEDVHAFDDWREFPGLLDQIAARG